MGSEVGTGGTPIEAAIRAADAQRFKGIAKALTGYLETLYDKGTTYTKLVLGVGYAGFFATWAGTKDLLTPKGRVLSALAVAVSLFFYVFFEVLQMIYQNLAVIGLARAANADPNALGQALQSYGAAQRRRERWFMRIWFVVLWLTLVPAVVGSLVLFYSFIRALLQM